MYNNVLKISEPFPFAELRRTWLEVECLRESEALSKLLEADGYRCNVALLLHEGV